MSTIMVTVNIARGNLVLDTPSYVYAVIEGENKKRFIDKYLSGVFNYTPDGVTTFWQRMDKEDFLNWRRSAKRKGKHLINDYMFHGGYC